MEKNKHKWLPCHVEYLKEIAKGKSTYEITKMFNERFNLNLTRSKIRSAMTNRGITNKVDTRFKKGKVPDNGHRFYKDDPRGIPYRFKKGNVPQTKKPIGTIKKRNGYCWEKVEEPNVWRQSHYILYEKHFGKIPDDKILVFKDKNKKNITIENLALISRKQLALLNRKDWISEDTMITDVGITLSELVITKSEKKKERKNERK